MKQRKRSNLFNRFLALFLAFVMVFSLMPVTEARAEVNAETGAVASSESKLYLKPNANWSEANARFAAYFFNDNENTWVSMTQTDETGVYEVDVPSGYPNVIFCRMNPATTENNWDNKWNQTEDLTVPSNGTNCYTVAADTWDKGGGTWSIYSKVEYTITIGDVTGGTVVSDKASALPGSKVTLTLTPNEGMKFSSLTVANSTNASETVAVNGEGNTRTFTMPDYNVTITAEFNNAAYEVTVNNPKTGGTVTVDKATANEGDTITLTVTPDAGQELASLTVKDSNGGDVTVNGKGNAYTFTMPAFDVTVTPTFETKIATATLHFVNVHNWEKVYLYAWTTDDKQIYGGWPGTEIKEADANGFYSATLEEFATAGKGLNFIFNDGSNNNTEKTPDLNISEAEFDEAVKECWVQPVYDGKKWAYSIIDTPAVLDSPVVRKQDVSFYYGNPDASAVSVIGNFGTDGASASYNMTKDANTGIWSITLESLEYGEYVYQFSVTDAKGTQTISDPMNDSWNSDGKSTVRVTNPDKDINEIQIKIHYTRTDGKYEYWNVYGWNAQTAGRYDFVVEGNDRVATITLPGRASSNFTFKVRKSTADKEWAEESGEIRVDLRDVLSGTVHLYITDKAESRARTYGDDWVTGNKITGVALDYQNNKILITANQEVEDTATAFSLVKGEDNTVVTMTFESKNGRTYTYIPEETLDLTTLYQYKVLFNEDVTVAQRTTPYDIRYESAYYTEKFTTNYTYSGDDLGVTVTDSATAFRLWAPTATAVKVNVYTSGTEGTKDKEQTLTMERSVKGTWTVTAEENLNGKYYTYSVTVDGEEVEVVDPYARSAGVNGKRGMILKLDDTESASGDKYDTDPEGWENDENPNKITSYTDAVIYELHVRDFSIDDSSGVKDEYQGKFMAFTEEGTKVPGTEISTGIDYLAQMDFTHLHLLPIYDYASVDETTCSNFNWGYDPQNYNVPEGSYSTDPYNGEVRVKEMKQMVQSLHENGISVVMDVVYNHVYDASTFSFNQIVPNYFSRPDSNRSGCGNDTASEREMVRKYIVESVLYWCEEYHLDGFRFDLVGLLDVETINQIVTEVHKVRPDVIFYGEGWDMDDTNQYPEDLDMAKQGNADKTESFGYFSDSMRNGLAGNNGNSTAFVSGNGNEDTIASNFVANPWWTTNPQQVIQYASCHDNYTLIDKLVVSLKETALTADIKSMSNLAAAIYMTAQGVPFIHAGEEFFREKIEENGERCENSYNAPDSVNKIVWSNLKDEDYAENVEWYQGLIDFRAAHPSLRLETAEEIATSVKCLRADSNLVIYQIDGSGVEGETHDRIYLIFNGSGGNKSISLPQGDWDVCITGTEAGADVLRTVSGTVTVPKYSPLVLVQKEASNAESVALTGSFDGWNTMNYLTQSADNENLYTTTIALTDDTYEFKLVVNGTYCSNDGTIDNETTVGWTMDSAVQPNCKLDANGGIYTFTYDISTGKLTVEETDTVTEWEDESGIQDGVTLHCWNWSFAEITENMKTIAEQGYTAIQTSPVQPMKEATVGAGKTYADNWWVFYQPVDFVINDEAGNALGTSVELKTMIETAHQYGVKVIVDVVTNHLGNKTGNDLATLIPEKYKVNSFYWHTITNNTENYGIRYEVTQLCMGGLPDLNTSNKELQSDIVDFLESCIDLGVDGFRFDAAKHIETPYDLPSFASDFWPTVVGGAETYAKNTYNKDLYLYGEILDSIWPLPAIAYTQYMSVTDNIWGNSVRKGVVSDSLILSGQYNMEAYANASVGTEESVGADADNLVIWAESHDTYATDNTVEMSRNVSDEDILKTWALVAGRADAMGLYLARPEDFKTQLLGEAYVDEDGWASDTVKAINDFHNDFAGTSEYVDNESGISYIERGDSGVILVNISGSSQVSVVANQMADGTYTDQLTGNTFTVANGKISGTIGETGIAVVDDTPVAVTVTSIAVNSTAHKTAYSVGDVLDVTGLTILVTKSNGSTETVNVTSDMVSGFNSSGAVAGQELTISYGGVTTTYKISVAMPVYKVTLQVNGGTITAGKEVTAYTFGTETVLPGDSDIKRSGYTFAGWYDNSMFKGTKYTKISADAKGDKVFYTKWLKNYKITYYLNGGKNNKKNPATFTVETKTIKLSSPTKKGYTFMGWYSDSGFKTRVKEIKKGTKKNIKLYAKWSKTYNITYVLNGGKNNKNNPDTFTVETKTFKLSNPTRKGYTFKGWYSDSGYKKRVKEIKKGTKKNIKLYAKWSKNTYVITYNLNGGKNSKKNPLSYTVTTKTFKLSSPTRKGYTFKGWYSDSKYKTRIKEIKKGSTGNLKLYAKWSKNTYKITYNLNGGKNSKKNPLSYSVTTKTFKLSNPTRKGYTFKGWYLDSKYKKPIKEIKKGTTGNLKLYAKWVKNK